MKKIVIYSLLSLIFNSLLAKHEVTLKVFELKFNKVKKNYPGGKVFKLQLSNNDTTVVLDTIGGNAFTIHIVPVLVSDNKNTNVQFSFSVLNETPNPKRPDLKGDNKEITLNNNTAEYGYHLKLAAKSDVGLIPFNVSKPGNEQMQVQIKKYQLKIKNKVINTEEWEGPLYLLANISTDTSWTNIKKGVQYGLVRKVISKSFNGERVYCLVLDVYEKKNGHITSLTQLKIDDINPGKELEVTSINCKNCLLLVENVLLMH